MSRFGSLFERLNETSCHSADTAQDDCIMASVAGHLAKMLSTRAGSVQTLPDYGLPDLNDMRLSLHDALSLARGAIERFIEAYEPRLSNAVVTSMPQGSHHLSLRFHIDALLVVEGNKRPVRFVASLDGSGQVTLR
ncbi:type VI secretion system baseplate subunit TssE [Pseudomonas alkylphenolica]|uniref:type VI secretion system baseplate subunit TssE n=1 Tax=Pseudomonas alkylphenolica TaxID=237609 RepID=UPI0018D5C3FF|nr:type VI secretion system baseplate subunit TssE [Pseudomonas alkylphenolica]MBH3428121.1 type VI secretion system baseplate subunit TssE [Pseudomonas alkylphenolica]